MKEIKPPFVRNPYNYDTNKAGDESGLSCPEPTRTKQAFKDEVDINTIVNRFNITGEIPAAERTPLDIQDVGTGLDFRQAWDEIIAARHSFEQLPAKIRSRFHNDPREFVDYALDPENRSDLEKWGMITPKPPVQEPLHAPQDKANASGDTKPTPKPKKGQETPPSEGGVT